MQFPAATALAAEQHQTHHQQLTAAVVSSSICSQGATTDPQAPSTPRTSASSSTSSGTSPSMTSGSDSSTCYSRTCSTLIQGDPQCQHSLNAETNPSASDFTLAAVKIKIRHELSLAQGGSEEEERAKEASEDPRTTPTNRLTSMQQQQASPLSPSVQTPPASCDVSATASPARPAASEEKSGMPRPCPSQHQHHDQQHQHQQQEQVAGMPAPLPRPRPPAPKVTSATLAIHRDLPAAMQRSCWKLEDFTVLKKLQTGYASRVYQATCNRSNQQVALKVYRLSVLPDLNRHQVYREVRLHSTLDHPAIIKLYAAFREKDKVVLVQQYADGGDLHSFLRRNQNVLQERQAVQLVLRPLLDALTYLHARGIVHRDIKLENILLTGANCFKLADFGLAINLNEERAVTRAGTLDMMAPEVVSCPHKMFPEENKHRQDKQYGCAVDVWAVGVLAVELVGGESPFKGGTPADTAARILHSAPSLPAPERCSEQAQHLMTWTLDKDVQQRPSLEQLLEHPWIRMHQRAAVPLKRSVSLRAYDLVHGTEPPAAAAAAAAATALTGPEQQQQEGPAQPAPLARPRTALRSSLPDRDAAPGCMFSLRDLIEAEGTTPRAGAGPAAVGVARREELGGGRAGEEAPLRELVGHCSLPPRSVQEVLRRREEQREVEGAQVVPSISADLFRIQQVYETEQRKVGRREGVEEAAGRKLGGGCRVAAAAAPAGAAGEPRRVLKASQSLGPARGGRGRRAGQLYLNGQDPAAVPAVQPSAAVPLDSDPDLDFKERIKSVIMRLSQGRLAGGPAGGAGGPPMGGEEEEREDPLSLSLPRMDPSPREAEKLEEAAEGGEEVLTPGQSQAGGQAPPAAAAGGQWADGGGGGAQGWRVRREWQYSRPVRPDALLAAPKRVGGAEAQVV